MNTKERNKSEANIERKASGNVGKIDTRCKKAVDSKRHGATCQLRSKKTRGSQVPDNGHGSGRHMVIGNKDNERNESFFNHLTCWKMSQQDMTDR